jgi:TRAP-type uncharacterized transport system substrate-binding protein
MRSWRAWGVAAAAAAATILVIALLLEFLAPDLAYQLRDRGTEVLSGAARQKYRIALGATSGSSYRVGTALNRYLQSRAGYELELVATAAPGNVGALLDRNQAFDLATINSADDDASKTDAIRGLAALETQYFFVIVPNASPAREFRDLTGTVNPGVREAGHPPTLGERVLEYYGLVPSPAQTDGQNARVSVVRPTRAGVLADFASGHTSTATRTQFLHAGLVDGILGGGGHRLLPIRDHEALARSIPGTRAAFIPAGLYGPERRIPAEAVPTIAVTQLLVARADIPGRVVRDILEIIYDPRFARELQLELTEGSGRDVGGLPLHRAADIYYHRNDLMTSDRLGRLSFVASAIAALVATAQFISRYRKNDLVKRRRRLLAEELAKLESIRQRIDDAPDVESARQLMRQAGDVLCGAEQDAAADLLDSAGIQSLRSLHAVSRQAVQDRVVAPMSAERQTSSPTPASAPPSAAKELPAVGA